MSCIFGISDSLMWVCMQVEATAKSVLGLYQRAIASADLLPSDKEDLSGRACTFADMCGSAAMQEAAERLHAARSDPALTAPCSSISKVLSHAAISIAFCQHISVHGIVIGGQKRPSPQHGGPLK